MNLKDKAVRAVLFSPTANFDGNTNGRVSTWFFPPKEEGDVHREIKYPTSDGLVLYLIKRIEKLEVQLTELKNKRK